MPILENPQQIQFTQDCFKSIRNIGETIHQNICDGTVSIVPWGSIDYIVGGSVVLILTLLLLGSIIGVIIRD